MDSGRPRALVLLARIASALAIASIAITGCNMPQTATSEEEASGAGGPFATSQQSLGASDRLGCPARAETWYLCLGHDITIHYFTPPGDVREQVVNRNCVAIPLASGGSSIQFGAGGGNVVDLQISGSAEDEDERCCFTGTNTITVTATLECTGTQRGIAIVDISEHWGTAQAEMHCTCKGDTDCHPYNGPIALAGLGDQEYTMRFPLRSSGSCLPLPIPGMMVMSGQLQFCLQNSEPVPDVGLVPLVAECP
jgi:hypothetical protein